jgi:hypothetical protein
MKLAIKSATSVKVVSNRLYVIVSGEGEKCRIMELGDNGMRDIVSFPGVLQHLARASW